MTLVVEPVTGSTARVRRPPPRRTPVASWRFAARLARREVRRRPARSVLVAALIAVPVLGMGVASVAATTAADSDTEAFARTAGQADIVIEPGVTDEALTALLPTGSTWLRHVDLWVPLRTPGGHVEQVALTDIDLSAPLADGIVEVQRGTAPAAGEVLLSAGVAEGLGVDVGDRLELDRPDGSWVVSGIGRRRAAHDEALVVMPDFDRGQLQPGYDDDRILIATPDHDPTAVRSVANDLVASVGAEGAGVRTASGDVGNEYYEPQLSGVQLAWGWVAGTIALAAVGVIIAAAFATSARRQLATIGQLSANGAQPSLVRRTLALQGSWSGLVGGVVGLAGTLVVASVGVRPWAERIAGRDVGPLAIVPMHLVVILATAVAVASVAALVPARSAARIPVMAALAGRRPLGSVPRRLVPLGVALFVGGVGLLMASAAASREGAGGNLAAFVAVVGGLGVLAGMCCTTPLAVDVLRRVPVGGAARLAVRGLVRQRTRSAAVVTAIATVGAISIAGATVVGRIAGDALDPVDDVPGLPSDAVLVQTQTWYTDTSGPFDAEQPPVPADVRSAVATIVPGSTSSTLQGVVPAAELPAMWQQMYGPASIVLADEAALELVGLSDHDTDALERTGVLAMRDDTTVYAPDGTVVASDGVELAIPTPRGGTTSIPAALRRDLPASWGGYVQYLVTPERADELGWVPIDAGLIVRGDEPLTDEQRSALGDLNGQNTGTSPWVADQGEPEPSYVWVDFQTASFEVSPALIEAGIVVVALLFTLVVVAIGLALAASEGRDERDVLVAVGARPVTMRRLAASRATTLTLVAAILAVPTGYLPVLAVYRATDGTVPGFPWLTALGIVGVVPLLAAGVTWIASAVAQRARPVRMSTLAVD